MAPEAEQTPVGHTVKGSTGYGAPAMPPTAEQLGGELPGGFRQQDIDATEGGGDAPYAEPADEPADSGDEGDKAAKSRQSKS